MRANVIHVFVKAHSIPRCWPVLKQFYCTISRLHSFMTLIIIISRFFFSCSLDDDIYFTKSTFNSFPFAILITSHSVFANSNLIQIHINYSMTFNHVDDDDDDNNNNDNSVNYIK